jgi:hypothetical protein
VHVVDHERRHPHKRMVPHGRDQPARTEESEAAATSQRRREMTNGAWALAGMVQRDPHLCPGGIGGGMSGGSVRVGGFAEGGT